MKRKSLIIIIAIVLVAIVIGTVYEYSIPRQNILYQVSAFNVFSAGNFDGNVSFSELARHGDFGIGTLNGLNGEMYALDGKFYQIPTASQPREIASSEQTPYATVTFFRTEKSWQITDVASYSQLMSELNNTLNLHQIYAIKINGNFDSAQTRSVPMQTKPYSTVTEAVKNQTIFQLSNVKGTAVGFFFPDFMNGVDAVGYHLHFLTVDHTAGGHLLDCKISNATVEIEHLSTYQLQIP